MLKLIFSSGLSEPRWINNLYRQLPVVNFHGYEVEYGLVIIRSIVLHIWQISSALITASKLLNCLFVD
jgi:hypothetical protein